MSPQREVLVLDHVHWDREWYRPHEAFRARLVELVERVVDDLEQEARSAFHLDGQTITVADVLDVRPDLEARLSALVRDGRLTIGPWHVLADNALVSGECLVRNLLIGRRWGARLGGLAEQGYSPDAFGHPADLPRVLQGFGLSTALVWRGAPPQHARLRWRAPDGSEVFVINQRYHEVEVLWDPATTAGRMSQFLDREEQRLPGGPWLLMNGGDHLMPRRVAERAEQVADAGVVTVPVGLPTFVEAAQAAASGQDLPVLEGDLRHLGDRLTFLLPGTLSTRTYLKQANVRAQTALSEWAEPLSVLAPSPRTPGLLRHAWELAVQNAPHDSVCGCSVDEVHAQNMVRAQQVVQVAQYLSDRALQRLGLETRRTAAPPNDITYVAVLNPHARPLIQGVEVDVDTAPGRWPTAVHGPNGEPVLFDVEDLGTIATFEADLDLVPDTAPAQRHRLAFTARGVPARGHAAYRVTLSSVAPPSRGWEQGRTAALGGVTVEVADDASVTLRDGNIELPGLGRLVDVGDRGDTYTWDPVVGDGPVHPQVRGSQVRHGRARTRLRVDAVLDLPVGLAADRATRAAETAAVPLEVTVTAWDGVPGLRWHISFDNTVDDHRLRWHVPTPAADQQWIADGLYSMIERPLGPQIGELPTEPGQEAEIGVAPVQGVAALGKGEGRVAVLCAGLPEVQGLAEGPHGTPELAVTLLRGVGWLSRFDLRARTTGAGPAIPTAQAQCHGKQEFELAVLWGDDIADDFALAAASAEHRAPLRAVQVHADPGTASCGDVISVDGGLVTAWKPAEDGDGSILRVSNPTRNARTIVIAGSALAYVSSVEESALDERRGTSTPVPADRRLELALPAFTLRTLRLLP